MGHLYIHGLVEITFLPIPQAFDVTKQILISSLSPHASQGDSKLLALLVAVAAKIYRPFGTLSRVSGNR